MITRTRVARGAVLLALVGVELWLARSMTRSPSIKGYIEPHSFAVSSSQKGLIRKIDVRLGEHVTAGQIIAVLESGLIDNDIAGLTAERRKLVAAARAGTPDDKALQAVDEKLEVLAERRDATQLKAPADGIIEAINVRPGDAVAIDTPVATIVTADTRHVVACVPEQRIGEVEVGSTADIVPAIGGAHLHGVVESLTPAVAELPPRCQPVVAKPPLFGRIAMVALDRAASSLPGETELIAFGPRAAEIPAVLGASEPVQTPQPLDVPPSLHALTRIEASGLVWEQSLDRYIVISDETGSRDRHAPWLFSMSRRGVLDAEPIIVSQLSELDDIESVASDQHDGLWLLASQSKSEKGNRPAARELLAHLVPEGIGYRADKQIRLAPLLAKVVDVDQLDIEGMAFHGGRLYFGLKSPLADGKATILSASPDGLLAGDASSVTVFGRVSLPLQADGKPAAGGISDLVFLSDSTLVIASTVASKKQQDGGVFLVHTKDFAALPMQTFRDLKPEGVALAPDGKIAVVFDRGRDSPLWTQLEPPHADL